MNKLYAIGCSLTYGQALEDCWDPKFKQPTDKPSKFAWPQLLADKLGYECINLSVPGASNKEILFILEKIINDIQNDDLLYIKWSFHDRHCVINNSVHNSLNEGCERVAQRSKKWKKWIRNFFTDEDGYWTSAHYIDYASVILKEKNIKYFYLYADRDFPVQLNCKYSNFVKDGSINLIRYNYPPALDNLHPGPEAHKVFAETIYENVKDLKNETTL